MSKQQNSFTQQRRSAGNKSSRKFSKKSMWHAFGLGREEPYRDPAALTFARLGLLATRW